MVNKITIDNFTETCKKIDDLVLIKEKISLGEYHSDLYDFNMSMIDINGKINIAFRSCNNIKFHTTRVGDWGFINTGYIINNKLIDIQRVYFHGYGLPLWDKFNSMEDPRLFMWNSERWILFVRPEPLMQNIKLILLSLDSDKHIFLEDPLGRKFNKNWMPYVDKNEQLFLITDINPLLIYKLIDKKMEKVIVKNSSNTSSSDFHGSSNVINLNNRLVALIHDKLFSGDMIKRPFYWHVVVSWNEDWSDMKIGTPFIFEKPGVEFSTSIMKKDEDIWISYSIDDQGMNILSLSKEEFGKLL